MRPMNGLSLYHTYYLPPYAMCELQLCFSGIDVVRNKIKMFAQQKVTLPPGKHKIVILDEADRSLGVLDESSSVLS
jgi:hypothetical protein